MATIRTVVYEFPVMPSVPMVAATGRLCIHADNLMLIAYLVIGRYLDH